MKKSLVLFVALLVGAGVGNYVGTRTLKQAELRGRLNSCNRIFGALAKTGLNFQVQCQIDGDDVTLASQVIPGLKFSLDGDILSTPNQ